MAYTFIALYCLLRRPKMLYNHSLIYQHSFTQKWRLHWCILAPTCNHWEQCEVQCIGHILPNQDLSLCSSMRLLSVHSSSSLPVVFILCTPQCQLLLRSLQSCLICIFICGLPLNPHRSLIRSGPLKEGSEGVVGSAGKRFQH